PAGAQLRAGARGGGDGRGGAGDLPRDPGGCAVRGVLHETGHLMQYPVLEVRGLVNRFGSQVVHNGLDMEVFQDEVFGIVGGSGSGKSVLLRTILGLQHPPGGTVRIEGHDITPMSEVRLRPIKARYGVAFQEGALYSGLTVLENVQLPMIEYFDLEKVVLDGLALLKIRLVGLPADAADKYPAQLSGGMIKRAAIARALALDP